MTSFYGGSPGLSMMIVKTYSSKDNMIIDFKSSDCTVGIGECVCLDTGLNDKQHGNVYRRNIDPNSPEYVCNISGPMGPGITYAATIKLNETEDINTQINRALGNAIDDVKTKNILCIDSKGATWVYAYDYTDGKWTKICSHDRYIITSAETSEAPVGLSEGGLWIKTQEVEMEV